MTKGVCETVEVVQKDHPLGHASINKSDMTDKHVLYKENKKEAPVKTKKEEK